MPIIFILVLLLLLAVGWLLYVLFHHQFIKAMYEGRLAGFFNKTIIGQSIYPLQYYIKKANVISANLSILFLISIFLTFAREKFIFFGFIIGYIIYCIIFIIKTSLVVDGIRYFSLFDDSMVSMQYAKNLIHGHGLVWNPGERVEGYTNFLWVIYMAFWHLFPISNAKISLPIQVSGAIFLISSLFLVRKIASNISKESMYVSIGAVLLTATYLPIVFWALRGMETSILGFIVLLATWRIFKCLEEKKFDLFLFIILGIGILVRVDFALLFVGVSVFIIIALKEKRKENLFTALSLFLLIVGTQTIFRWVYYGDILPNTYYAKVTGLSSAIRIQAGLFRAKNFIKNMSLFLFAAPFVYYILHMRNKKIRFLLYIFLLQFFYSIYIGGDAWEHHGPLTYLANRFLCIVMPVFFILMCLMLNYLVQRVRFFYSKHLNTPLGLIKEYSMNIIAWNIIFYAIFQMYGRPLEAWLHSLDTSTMHLGWDHSAVRFGLKLKEITAPNAKIALTAAGAIPYFSERYCIDLLGKMDPVISRQKAKVANPADFRPGHNKWDYSYSIGALKPDIVAQLRDASDVSSPYLNKYYDPAKIEGFAAIAVYQKNIFCRKDSSNIYWDKVKKL